VTREAVADRSFVAALAALTALAALLRFLHLDFQELWLDEALQLRMAGAERLSEALRLEYSPPLGYLLWRFWIGLFGESEFALRSLAALLGTAFVPAIVVAGRAILTPAAGLFAGALAALAPLHVYYSQEARAYSLLCLAILWSHLTLWRALERPEARRFAAFAATCLVMLFVHHFGALTLLPAPLLVLWWPRDDATRRRWRGFLVAGLVVAVPWLAWIGWSWLANAQIERGYIWVRQIWQNIPPALAIPKSLELLVLGPQHQSIPGFFKQFTILEFPGALRALGVLAIALLAGVAVGPWGDRELGLPGLARRKAWLLSLVLVPLSGLFAASFWLPVYAIGRYDLIALPPWLLLLGLGFAKLRRLTRAPRAAAPLVAAALFGVLGAKLALYYSLPVFSGGGPARATAQAIDAHVRDGDLVLFTAYRGATVGYYLRRIGYREARGVFERERRFTLRRLPTHPSSLFFNVDHPERTSYSLEQTREDLRGYLAALDPARNTVWLEALPELPRLPRFKAMLREGLEAAGFEPAPPPPELAGRHVRPWRAIARRPGLS
jgi:4-amino-4-deoxy-L-arabinose transferase-like glycosyltransferase